MKTKYRDEPNRYCELVFFDSHEETMENSELPETQEYAKKMHQDDLSGDVAVELQ